MTNTINVLDHGWVKLRNLAGPTRRSGQRFIATGISNQDGEPTGYYEPRCFDADDTDVANAARLSFEGQDQSRSYTAEMKLTRYLAEHHHDTPFEIIEVWLEMKLPIFVARQFVRQRTQTINEASGRYITLPEEWYIPEIVGGKAASKKQGQEDNLHQNVQDKFKRCLNDACKTSYAEYLDFIALGVAPEHARLFLHVNHYTHWMTKMNLRNLLFSLLRLRDHSHAQIEAQVYARAVVELLDPHLPGLMNLYRELIRQ